ncbi:uncharacterized protein K452DRAFT_267809 [Aplosporella prunicola CBS 121167]|uniref:AB hydrolase-1 domain-containing protein n=1 Tax=Aplosporella prunicola CBS 121167 TaxID=1176127 RepID=A0A6A6BJP7_9PEZI|nr:uncharacterized protein K452DRAFT_267809 [Aplosporella prunicola CBS 121167]KAF2143603.1 hypothetical protein K452DRAFT_267809 [Aplosporella prunicola CBS 121167]
MEGPSIPALPSQRTATSNPTRHSLPAGRVDERPSKRDPSRPRPKPASPEVISSLIDSLSAISLPAHDHFENNIPTIGGSGPGTSYSVPASPADRDGFGVTYGVHRNERWEEEKYQEDIDDAAAPPVIKTAKPPSGFSPLTAPPKPKQSRESSKSSLKNYIRSASRSSTSLTSRHSSVRDDASSIASSIQRGLRRHSSTSRASLDSRTSARRTRSLGYTSSRERLRGSRDTDMRSAAGSPISLRTSGLDSLSFHRGGSGPPSPRKSEFKHSPMIEEEESPQVSLEPPADNDAASMPKASVESDRRSRRSRRGPEIYEGAVPSRTSSLRNQSRSPSATRARSSCRESSRSRAVIEDNDRLRLEPVDEREPKGKEKALDDDEEDNDVTRRIKELKRQKEERERASERLRLDLTVEDDGARPQFGPLSPTSRVIEMEERSMIESIAKAHRLLGLTPTTPPRSAMRSTPTVETALEAQARSPDPSRKSEDSLPIDYELSLQSLSRTSMSTIDDAKARKVLGTPPSIARSHSDAASVMKERNKRSLEEAAERLDLHVNLDTPPESRVPSRAASAEPAPRQQSVYLPPPSPRRSNSISLGKKRWSHSDVPSKSEPKHNEKLFKNAKTDRELMAVKPPYVPEPVLEEPPRPSSIDSIDDEVETFLLSPRLTQRVREPNSGRTICFSEVGDPQGFVVFCCVGMGLTRYVTAFYDELATSLKLRLITPDRPGVGESQADPNGTPLSWPDDVSCICQALRITKFSIMAHSAGAIYALATALRMPQHIRGRVHLLAPWIPPSQMTAVGLHVDSPHPDRQLPRAQRLLRVLPTPLLKVANSTFMSATSASLTRSVPKSPRDRSHNKRKTTVSRDTAQLAARLAVAANKRDSMMLMDRVLPDGSALDSAIANPDDPNHEAALSAKAAMTIAEQNRRREYDTRLTLAVWDLATTNANPAVDLLVCLERSQAIGFRYVDITRPVVIHHGSRDTRVPVDNVKWLGRTMRRCEVRILEGEGHGLMASAVVMGNVLTEVAKEWEDWTAVTKGGGTKARPPTGRTESSFI